MHWRAWSLGLALALGTAIGCAEPEEFDAAGAEQGDGPCEAVASSPPLPGDACDEDGLSCDFADECTTCKYTCSSGAWQRTCNNECDGDTGGVVE